MPSVVLQEWERCGPEEGPPLANTELSSDPSVQRLAAALGQQGILNVSQLQQGLQLEATSYVGRLQLGDLTITIRPKLVGLPLLRLMSYAYKLRDLQLIGYTDYSPEEAPFQDLLIGQLIVEAKALLRRGARRDYLRAEDALAVPRGRINFGQLVRCAGAEAATLPCQYYPRTEDCLPNQIVLAGLRLASRLANDLLLRTEVRKLGKLLDDKVKRVSLDRKLWSVWRRSRNRLTENYEPAIRIIQLLWSSSSISLADEERDLPLPGFLFDMNRFFQRLLTRFLEENLAEYHVRSEHRLHGTLVYAPGWNPQHRHDPAPRPDIALLQGRRVVRLLDAKYRDIWETSLPREMLYQLAIYALSGQGDGKSVLLYGTTSSEATESRIEVRDPITDGYKAMVLVRPVNLVELDRVLGMRGMEGMRSRQEYAFTLAHA